MLDILATPSSTDIAYGWIQILFPMDPESPYASAMAVFTGMVTFLGSLFVAWHVLSGIVMSAYTGKVLGQKFHQIWAPLRVVLGFGLLVPISGGFSPIHFLLRDVVGVAAVQMGNQPIRAYIVAATKAKPENTKVAISANRGRFIFDEVLRKEICYEVYNGIRNNTWSAFLTSKVTIDKYPPASGEDSKATGYLHNVTKAGGIGVPDVTSNDGDYTWDYGSCGSLTFLIPTSLDVSSFAYDESQLLDFVNERRLAMKELVEAARSTIEKGKLSEYFKNHDVEDMSSSDLLKELRTEGVIKSGLAAIKADAVARYDKKVASAAATIYKKLLENSGKELTKRIDTYGFMAAGSFERTLSKASAASVTSANASPEVVDSLLTEEFEAVTQAATTAIFEGARLPGEPTAGGALLGTSVKDDPTATLLAWIAPSVAAMKMENPGERDDPIGDMILFGHNLIGIWEAGFLALTSLRAVLVAANEMASATKSSATGILSWGAMGIISAPLAVAMDLLNQVQNWVAPLFVIILLAGILHAFVLPMIPMMMVFVMGVSWLIMFLEASIAAILWAFVFIRMDGDEFVDRAQSQGASLLFNLFLRPAIGMLAFVGGLILLPKIMNSLTILWDDGFAGQTSPDLTGLFQWVVGVVLYTWLQWHLSLRLFGLIPTIADRVGSWMGMNGHSYNDGQETTAVIGALGSSAGAIHKFAPNQAFGKAADNKARSRTGNEQ